MGLVIELKGIAGEDEGFVASVLSALDGYVGPMAIMSFDHWLLEEARTLNARMPVGLTAEGDESTAKAHADFCEKNGIEFVSYGMLDLPNSFVKSFRESGKPVIDWTVRSPEQAAFSYQHVDQITFEGFLA